MSAKKLLVKYEKLINKHDFDLVSPLLSTDCKFWFSNGTHNGVVEVRKAFEKTWNMIQKEVYTITDLEWIGESDEAASCVYTFNWKGVIDGELCEGKGRGTSCFRIEQGE